MSLPFTTDGSLILGPAILNAMPADLRFEIFRYAFPGLINLASVENRPSSGRASPTEPEESEESHEENDAVMAEFSEPELLDLISGCSEKTRQVLGLIAAGERRFNLAALARTLNVDAGRLGGVWSGLTRRTRNLKNNADMVFLDWEWDTTTDSYWGILSEVTHASMKKLLASQP